MATATRTRIKTTTQPPEASKPEAPEPTHRAPRQTPPKRGEVTYVERAKQRHKPTGDISRKDARELIGTLDLVARPLAEKIERGKAGIGAIERSTESGLKGTKTFVATMRSQIDSDEKTLQGIEDAKKSISARTGKATGEGVLESIANAKPKDITKPEHKAQAILASAAQSLIAKGSPRPVVTVKSVKVERLVPIREGKKKLDIRGSASLPGRILPGVAYSDRKGQRLSRVRRRHWKRIKLT